MRLLTHLAFFAVFVGAAWIDLRERRIPNELALLLTVVGAFSALLDVGPLGLVRRAAASLALCGGLVVMELLWRRMRRRAGMGMGDIKALFAVVLTGPFIGLSAFVIGLIGLALTGASLRRRALPFLPFLAGGYAIVIGFMQIGAS